MSAANSSLIDVKTIADLLNRLGGIPADRVRFHPFPGSAVEQDLIDLDKRGEHCLELVDGTLVEKGMGLEESILAGAILAAVRAFVIPRKMGLVAGEAGMFNLFPGCVRLPDVAYASHAKRKGRPITQAAPPISPDLAVEVLSVSNTPREMQRKITDYFQSGVELVWIFDPRERTVAVYAEPARSVVLDENGVLDGGHVLPGFMLPIKPLFDEMEEQMGLSST